MDKIEHTHQKKKNSKQGQRIISPPGGKFKQRTMKGIYRLNTKMVMTQWRVFIIETIGLQNKKTKKHALDF